MAAPGIKFQKRFVRRRAGRLQLASTSVIVSTAREIGRNILRYSPAVNRDFYGAGRKNDSRKSAFEFTNGEPPVLLGNNEGANPVEFLLHALAGCVTTTFILHAMARGIAIKELSTELEGDLDVQGLLGLDDSVTPGYEQIRIRMHVKADCPERDIDDLLAYGQRHSPVCNTVCRPVPVMIERI
jgi:uncharacterized OsmC-like protein